MPVHGTDSSSNTGSVVEYFTRSDECQIAEADSGARVVKGLGAHAAFAAGNTDEVLAVTLDEGRCFFVHGTYSGESDTSRQAVAKVIVSTPEPCPRESSPDLEALPSTAEGIVDRRADLGHDAVGDLSDTGGE